MVKKKTAKTDYNAIEYKYRLLSDLMDYIPDVIYFKDISGKLIMVNESHAKGLGLKPSEVVGKTDFDIFPADQAEKMTQDDRYVMQTGKAIIDKVERSTRPDGRDNYVSTTKIPRRDKNGKIVGVLGITRDITHRMQLETLTKENEIASERLEIAEELNRTKSDLLLEISHELRAPLQSLQKAMNTIEGSNTAQISGTDALSTAKNSISHLTQIVDGLVDISKLESNKYALHNSLVNLNDLILCKLEFFQKWAEEKNIKIDYSIPKSPINIFMDADRIEQVIANLINNAIKYTKERGTLKLKVKLLETKVRISVTDSGIGIPEHMLPHLFNLNKFMELSGTNEPERLEVGLGLSIARKIVDQHDGEIWVESKRGKGSTFYFTIPRQHSMNILKRKLRYKINALLPEAKSLYMQNLLIINFKDFKRRIKVDSLQVFNDINAIIYKTLNSFKVSENLISQVVIQDYHNGEWSILHYKCSQIHINSLSRVLNKEISKYFVRKKLENVFINIGTEKYPLKATDIPFKKINSNLKINPRDSKKNKANISISFSSSKTDITQVLNISSTSIQFITQKMLKTDMSIDINLHISPRKILELSGIVRWVKSVKEVTSGLYKVGLELKFRNNSDRELLKNFIREEN